ncbi:hypothetical protein PVK06_031244 [Gossypium arboreum]|uniref:Uncharacterized protein n=1 Tax=Gossypium arboreum TaxID=29729 RepID=A0ABR0NQK3_GOSAR|nr:hypothetical protein PVK06_031244 [Gossypium arboreum]
MTLEALNILEEELQRSSRHQLDSSNCGCKLRHSCGIPCACMLSIYLNSGGECIPLDSIDVFWRKLDLSPSTSVENEDICCDGELEMFKENFTKRSKAGKKDELLSSYDVYARVFTNGIDELRNSLCFSQSPAPAEH